MNKVKDYNGYGEALERMLLLRTSPIAIKLTTDKDMIPIDAICPKKDQGIHIALCQAFAMSRRQNKTVFMQKEDHWCWAPLIAFGAVEFHEKLDSFKEVSKHLGIADLEKAKEFTKKFPRVEYGKYNGILSAPLSTASFEPDLVLIYSNPAQLRSMLWSMKNQTGSIVKTEMDGIDSCVYSIIPLFKNGECRVTVPDPGEYERANAAEEEIIFSVPKDKLQTLVTGLEHFEEIKLGYRQLVLEMRPDYPRPQFYNNLFEIWGLDVGEVWSK